MAQFIKFATTSSIIAAASIGAAVYIGSCFYIVNGGYRSIVFSRLTGIKNKVYGEGTNFCISGLEKAYQLSVRTQASEISCKTGSRDLQDVKVEIRILYRPNIESLPALFKDIGPDYSNKILPSISNEVLKSVVAQFNASQLITMRQQVSLNVRNQLIEKAKKFHIIIDDIAITHLSFSSEYAAAVEAKQIAQQEAQRAAFIVEQARQERQRKIVQAEGEAEAAKMLGKAIAGNSGYLELRKIRAAQKIAKLISKGQPKSFIDSGILLLDL